MDGKQADNYAGQGTGGRGVRNRERTKLMENNSVGAARGQAWVEVGNNGKRTPSLGILPRKMALQGCRFAYSSIFHSEDNCSTPGAPTLPTHPAKELVGPTACFCVACQLRVVDTFLNSEKELHDVNYTDSSSSAHQHSSVGTRPSSFACYLWPQNHTLTPGLQESLRPEGQRSLGTPARQHRPLCQQIQATRPLANQGCNVSERDQKL